MKCQPDQFMSSLLLLFYVKGKRFLCKIISSQVLQIIMVTELLSDLGCLNHLLISQGIFMLNNKSTNQRNQLSIPFRFSTFYHASFAPVKLCSSSESGKKRSAESSKKPRAFLFQSLRRGFVKLLLKLLQNKTVFKHSNCDSLFC